MAPGPVHQEMETILYTSSLFEQSQSYFHFVANFNLRNKYSMVCHPVGLHKDVFNCGTESLENKVLFVRTMHNDNNGRGGSLFANNYCFALLDWGFSGKAKRAWRVANLARFGVTEPGQ